MERERPQPNPEKEAERAVEDAASELPPQPLRASGQVCPYCKDDLGHGELASDCNGCHTLHHVQCFAENRGCAIHGCGAQRATSMLVGQGAPGLPQATCIACRKAVEPGALVARCSCSRIHDVECYGKLGRCLWPTCRGTVELMSQQEAQAANRRRAGNILGAIGGLSVLIPLLLIVLAFTVAPSGEVDELLTVAGILFGVISVPTLLGGLAWRISAQRVARLPGPGPGPPRARADPPKKEAAPGSPQAEADDSGA